MFVTFLWIGFQVFSCLSYFYKCYTSVEMNKKKKYEKNRNVAVPRNLLLEVRVAHA